MLEDYVYNLIENNTNHILYESIIELLNLHKEFKSVEVFTEIQEMFDNTYGSSDFNEDQIGVYIVNRLKDHSYELLDMLGIKIDELMYGDITIDKFIIILKYIKELIDIDNDLAQGIIDIINSDSDNMDKFHLLLEYIHEYDTVVTSYIINVEDIFYNLLKKSCMIKLNYVIDDVNDIDRKIIINKIRKIMSKYVNVNDNKYYNNSLSDLKVSNMFLSKIISDEHMELDDRLESLLLLSLIRELDIEMIEIYYKELFTNDWLTISKKLDEFYKEDYQILKGLINEYNRIP